MREIKAYVRPERVADVVSALADAGVANLTMNRVRSLGSWAIALVGLFTMGGMFGCPGCGGMMAGGGVMAGMGDTVMMGRQGMTGGMPMGGMMLLVALTWIVMLGLDGIFVYLIASARRAAPA